MATTSERHLASLSVLARRCRESRSLEEALQLVTDCALETLDADHTSVRLLDDQRELASWARSGVGSTSLPIPLRAGEGIAGWVCDNGEALLLRDASTDIRFLRNDAQGFTIRSLLALPLWSGGRVAGVLAATHALPDRFEDHHLGVGQLLVNAVQPILERSRGSDRGGRPPRLDHALASPLRLRLVAELLEAGPAGLSLDEL